MITAKDNAHIKHIRKLMGRAKARREEGLFILEGYKPVAEALRRGLVRELVLSGGLMTAEESVLEKVNLLREQAKEQSVPVIEIARTLFDGISDTVTPQGILVVARMPSYDRASIYTKTDCRLLCLEDVRDPGNIGTMIRTAEGAGMDGVLLSPGCADVFQPKVVRSTMGSILRVPCLFCEGTMEEELKTLRKEGFMLYAAHLQGSVDYREPDYEGRTGILIGNEASGLSEAVTACADFRVRIPMEGELESLNAAVSAALLMYEIRR